MTARIILLNGTSSAGKSTLARALRPLLPVTFCYYASDQLADQGFRPVEPDARWEGRNAFFDGFHRSIAAFAAAGLDLLVEHIFEQAEWVTELDALLQPYDLFKVGVHAPVRVLEAREQARGDRTPGEAREHLTTHDYCTYNLEVETTEAPMIVAERVIRAWKDRHTASF
jgi:chloramphenicol 3-O phosphotransferase